MLLIIVNICEISTTSIRYLVLFTNRIKYHFNLNNIFVICFQQTNKQKNNTQYLSNFGQTFQLCGEKKENPILMSRIRSVNQVCHSTG